MTHDELRRLGHEAANNAREAQRRSMRALITAGNTDDDRMSAALLEVCERENAARIAWSALAHRYRVAVYGEGADFAPSVPPMSAMEVVR